MYTISEISKKLKVSNDTIRYYEKIGLFPKRKRNSSGYRIYSDLDLFLFKFILQSKKYGFTLNEIKPIVKYLDKNKVPPKNLEQLLRQKIEELSNKQKEISKLKKQLLTVSKSCSTRDCSILEDLIS